MLLSAPAAKAQDLEALKHGIVRVRSYLDDGTKSTGTAFVVRMAPDIVHLVTATHVVQGAVRVEVEFFSRRDLPVEARVGRMERDIDRGIAYLVVPGPAPDGTRALPLAPAAKLKEGLDLLLTIGFPPGVPGWSVRSLRFSTRDGRELLLDGSAMPGNSGGPLLRDTEVVGLVQSEANGFVRANSAGAIAEFLEGSGVRLDRFAARKADAATPDIDAPEPGAPVDVPQPSPAAGTASPRITGASKGSRPPQQADIAAMSPVFHWGTTVRRTGQLLLSRSDKLWLRGSGGAERITTTHPATLQVYDQQYLFSATLHVHELPLKVVVETDRLLSGNFMSVCEADDPCQSVEGSAPESTYRDAMQRFMLEVSKATLRQSIR